MKRTWSASEAHLERIWNLFETLEKGIIASKRTRLKFPKIHIKEAVNHAPSVFNNLHIPIL